jgi:hypothetical protein
MTYLGSTQDQPRGLFRRAPRVYQVPPNTLVPHAWLDYISGSTAFVAQIPVATRIEAEPAVAMRHSGPFGEGLFDDVVHEGIVLIQLIAPPSSFPRRRESIDAGDANGFPPSRE